jgi:hypothetical protein
MAIGAVLWTGAEDWGDMVGEVTDRSRTMYGTSIPPQVCPSACLPTCRRAISRAKHQQTEGVLLSGHNLGLGLCYTRIPYRRPLPCNKRAQEG